MIIKSLLQRKGGTEIEMGNNVYFFSENENGDHVCEVTNPEHIERFLSITEGFEEVKGAVGQAISNVKQVAVNAVSQIEQVATSIDDGKKKDLSKELPKPSNTQANSKPK